MSDLPLYDEKIVLHRVAKGDEGAFRALYDHYQQKVFFIAFKLLHSQESAKDVVQEVFLKLWFNREKLAEVNHVSAYLNTVVRNHIYSRFRTQAIEEVLLSELLQEETPSEDSPLERLSLRTLQQALHEAVEQLAPQQKRVFRMSRMEGLKHEEIATQLQISKETVKKHMMEALRHIKAYLSDRDIAISVILLFYLWPL